MLKHATPPAGTRAGRVAAVTVGVPAGVFTAGYGMARDAQLTAWLLLVLLVGSVGYVVMRWVLRSWAGPR
ncbi:hypothetical protein AB0M91_17720 [Micromonospora rifamycinica]|uniref:hypothetical protein n=1 Tax=Micromonospora rifamycinica TaxID=291594 RepID=UPI00341264BD